MPSPLALSAALLNLLFAAVALIASRRQFAAAIPRAPGGRHALLLMLVLAFGVRAFSPYEPLMWNDEWFYHDQAESLMVDRLNTFCTFGEPSTCRSPAMFYPIGYPLVLSLGMSLTGSAGTAARLVGVLAGTATVAVTYLLARLLIRDDRAALTAALVIALLPMHVRYAVEVRSDVLGAFAECLAVLAAVMHVRSRRDASGWLAALSFAFAATVRREALLVLVPIAVVYRWGGKRGVWPSLLPWVVAFALLVPHIAETPERFWNQMYTESVKEYEDFTYRLHPRHIASNLQYISYWVDGYFQPFLFTAMALAGCAAMARLAGPFASVTALWFVSRIAPYLLHSYTVFIPRYMLALSVPFALACGAAAAVLSWPAETLTAALLVSGALHLPFAYGPLFGLELPGTQRWVLGLLHAVVPITLLLWGATRAAGRERRVVAVALVACLVLVPALYSRVTRTDGLPGAFHRAFALESSTIDGWRVLVGEECFVVVPSPVPYRALWQRPLVMRASHLALPATVAQLHDDVVGLLDDGACVFLYETQRMPDIDGRMVHDTFVLEHLDSVSVPPEEAEATGMLQKLALYRVVAPKL
ncbi:MAG: glycosyltransferase family 39 protein [Candidatus Undinarchaeales archaeon]|nr:glycosyltransferase family 39 protein [Candidatus Undinarchaeales archaeon]